MVTPGNSERNTSAYNWLDSLDERLLSRTTEDKVTCIDNEIRLLCIENFIHSLKSYVSSAVAVNHMCVCKLNDLELAVLVELEHRLLCVKIKNSCNKESDSKNVLSNCIHKMMLLVISDKYS